MLQVWKRPQSGSDPALFDFQCTTKSALTQSPGLAGKISNGPPMHLGNSFTQIQTFDYYAKTLCERKQHTVNWLIQLRKGF